jgi:hypothetical protein
MTQTAGPIHCKDFADLGAAQCGCASRDTPHR